MSLRDIGSVGNDHDGEIQVVPLIDIVFLLMIFLLMTTSFDVTHGYKVALPQSQTTDAAARKEQAIVLVGADGILHIDGVAVADPDALRARIGQSKTVAVQADRAARYEDVVRAMDWLKGIGVTDVLLSTNAATARPDSPASR